MFFFFKQKTAYEMRISDWSSDVCSSDLIGAFAYPQLPLAQYPEIAPPTISISAAYPGASSETMAETVAATLEQEINGVENMLYLQSSSTQGQAQITVTFEPGTDLDAAQVLVQNRVALAEPRLPEQLSQIGVQVNKQECGRAEERRVRDGRDRK